VVSPAYRFERPKKPVRTDDSGENPGLRLECSNSHESARVRV